MAPKPYKKYLEKDKKSINAKQSIFTIPLTSAWWLLMIFLTFLVLAINFMPEELSLKEGEYAPNNIYYFGTAASFVSQEQTNEAKKMVAAEIGQIYKRDDMVVVDLHKSIDEIFIKLDAVKSNDDLSLQEKNQGIVDVLGNNASKEVISYYLGTHSSVADRLSNTIKEAVAKGYLIDVTEEELSELITSVKGQIKDENYILDARNFMYTIVDMLKFRPNKVFDQVATLQAVERALSTVQPIQVKVNPGQLIISSGQEISKADLETLYALGLQKEGGRFTAYMGLLLLVVLCFYLLRVYCNRLSPDMLKQKNSISVIWILLFATLILGRLLTVFTLNNQANVDLMMGLLVPVPAFAMLSAALVNKRVAIFATIIVSVFVGILCGGHMLYILAALIGGLVGVIQVSNLDQRSKYAMASLYIALAYAAVVLAWSLMWNYSMASIGIGLLMSAINGVLSVILAIGTLPFLESAFKITTEVRLLELSNTNHPLLKKLMIEAPGTYNHSVLVGNLAEAAADEIGANGLLVRVASYFHDIGKTKRPYFFIENQKLGENPHDKLQPSLSTFIITSHTKEGAELAKRYKLPTEIIDIIEQHHGTGMVSFFYRRALENAKAVGLDDTIRPEDFRYLGPKPQTKEAALVMLADSSQAAVQSMDDPTSGQMEGKIREVIKSKVDDGQLENCDLTFKDLDVIATTFTKVLAGVNHHRIAYPAQLEMELQKRTVENRQAQVKMAGTLPELKIDDKKVAKVANKAETKSENKAEVKGDGKKIVGKAAAQEGAAKEITAKEVTAKEITKNNAKSGEKTPKVTGQEKQTANLAEQAVLTPHLAKNNQDNQKEAKKHENNSN